MSNPPTLASGVTFSALCLCLAALLAGAAAMPDAPEPGMQRVVLNGTIQWRAIPVSPRLPTDTLLVADWRGPHRGAELGAAFATQVVPYDGAATRIEALFEEQCTVWVDGMGYRISDGVFKGLQGARVWVAVNPRAPSAAPVPLHVVLLELNGAIYYGALQKAVARFD